jgi:hypothetical protein
MLGKTSQKDKIEYAESVNEGSFKDALLEEEEAELTSFKCDEYSIEQ